MKPFKIVVITFFLVLCVAAQAMTQIAPSVDGGGSSVKMLLDLPQGITFGMSESEIFTGDRDNLVYEEGFVKDNNVVVIENYAVTRSYFFEDDKLTTFSYHIEINDGDRQDYLAAYLALEALLSGRNTKILREMCIFNGNPVPRQKACEMFSDSGFIENIRFIKAWGQPYPHYVSMGLDAGRPYCIISFKPALN